MEVAYHSVGYREVVRREDKLVGPSFEFFQMSVCTYGSFDGTHHCSTYGTHTAATVFGLVDNAACFCIDKHLL